MAGNGTLRGDVALAAALAAGATVRDAAAQAGISERTAHRRQGDPNFRRQVSELRGAMVGQTTGRLAAAAVAAADQLRELMAEAESETVRLQAARALLDAALRFQATTEFEQRLADLEQRMGQGGPGQL